MVGTSAGILHPLRRLGGLLPVIRGGSWLCGPASRPGCLCREETFSVCGRVRPVAESPGGPGRRTWMSLGGSTSPAPWLRMCRSADPPTPLSSRMMRKVGLPPEHGTPALRVDSRSGLNLQYFTDASSCQEKSFRPAGTAKEFSVASEIVQQRTGQDSKQVFGVVRNGVRQRCSKGIERPMSLLKNDMADVKPSRAVRTFLGPSGKIRCRGSCVGSPTCGARATITETRGRSLPTGGGGICRPDPASSPHPGPGGSALAPRVTQGPTPEPPAPSPVSWAACKLWHPRRRTRRWPGAPP